MIIATAFHILDQLDWTTALLLAAILSPTDPIAVLGLFRQLHVNERLSTVIEGESLFNDGVAGSLYQTFLALVLLTLHGQAPTELAALGNGLLLFVVEAGGGLLFGAFAGFLISRVLRRIDDPVVETTITLLSAYGIYWVADAVHLSAIIAVLVTALILGNYGRSIGMSEGTSTDADTFWRMLAFLGNALIFLLMGVQIHPFARQLLAGPALTTWLVILVAIGVVLLARFALVLVLTVRSWVRLPRKTALPLLAPLAQAAAAARLAVDRVLERAAGGTLACPGTRAAAGCAFARGAGGFHLCRRSLHATHPGVEPPLGVATRPLSRSYPTRSLC